MMMVEPRGWEENACKINLNARIVSGKGNLQNHIISEQQKLIFSGETNSTAFLDVKDFQFALFQSTRNGEGKRAIILVAQNLLRALQQKKENLDKTLLYTLFLLEAVSQQPFVIVHVHDGMHDLSSKYLNWLQKLYKLIPTAVLERVAKIYVLTSSRRLRSMMWLARPFTSTRVWRKIEYVHTKSRLVEKLGFVISIPPTNGSIFSSSDSHGGSNRSVETSGEFAEIEGGSDGALLLSRSAGAGDEEENTDGEDDSLSFVPPPPRKPSLSQRFFLDHSLDDNSPSDDDDDDGAGGPNSVSSSKSNFHGQTHSILKKPSYGSSRKGCRLSKFAMVLEDDDDDDIKAKLAEQQQQHQFLPENDDDDTISDQGLYDRKVMSLSPLAASAPPTPTGSQKTLAMLEQEEEQLNGGEVQKRSDDIPPVVVDAVNFLCKHGKLGPGLFRIPGEETENEKLKSMYDKGARPINDILASGETVQQTQVHTVASLLKAHFRELDSPIIPEEMFNEIITLAKSIDDPNTLAYQLGDRMVAMPQENLNTLGYLIHFLAHISTDEDWKLQTKMDTKNLTIVWAPNLLRRTNKDLATNIDPTVISMRQFSELPHILKAVACMINNAEIVFPKEMLSQIPPEINHS